MVWSFRVGAAPKRRSGKGDHGIAAGRDRRDSRKRTGNIVADRGPTHLRGVHRLMRSKQRDQADRNVVIQQAADDGHAAWRGPYHPWVRSPKWRGGLPWLRRWPPRAARASGGGPVQPVLECTPRWPSRDSGFAVRGEGLRDRVGAIDDGDDGIDDFQPVRVGDPAAAPGGEVVAGAIEDHHPGGGLRWKM